MDIPHDTPESVSPCPCKEHAGMDSAGAVGDENTQYALPQNEIVEDMISQNKGKRSHTAYMNHEGVASCPFCHVPLPDDLAYCPHCGSRVSSPEYQEDFSEFFDHSLERATALKVMGGTSTILGILLCLAPGFNDVAKVLLGGEMTLLGVLCLLLSQKEYSCPRCGASVDLDDVCNNDGKKVLCHDCYTRIR